MLKVLEIMAAELRQPLPLVVDPFLTFCRFAEWCLRKCQGVVKNPLLQVELTALIELCSKRERNQDPWTSHANPLMAIAMGDVGGAEGRACDVAYAIVMMGGSQKMQYADVGIRKMLRLADANEIYTALMEANSGDLN